MPTVPTEVSEKDFTGNAATLDFPCPFPILDETDLVVTLLLSGATTATTQVLGVDYTVDEAPSDSPTVTMAAAPPSLSTLHIERTVPMTQVVNLLTQGPMSPATFTQMADKDRMVDQQLDRRISALEALGSLVTLTTFDAQLVTVVFTTDKDDVLNTFHPGVDISVAVAVGRDVTGVLVARAQNEAESDDLSREAIQVIRYTYAAGVLTLWNVSGLETDTEYTLTLLVLSMVLP